MGAWVFNSTLSDTRIISIVMFECFLCNSTTIMHQHILLSHIVGMKICNGKIISGFNLVKVNDGFDEKLSSVFIQKDITRHQINRFYPAFAFYIEWMAGFVEPMV